MDPPYSDMGGEDSHSRHARSRASSSVSTTEALFQGLQLVDSPRSLPLGLDASRPSSSRGLASSPSFLITPYAHSGSYLPTPVSQTATSPFPPLTDDILDAGWFDIESSRTQATPLLRVEPAVDYSGPPASSPPVSTSEPANMSTIAIQHFDPVFSMGSRSSFTWPVIDSSSGYLGHDLSAYGSEASLSPPTASRSITASPPRGPLTAEQRELKRQRDQARRDSKNVVRIRRAGSGSFGHSPPVTMADLAAVTSAAMPVYTSAPTQITLLTEPATTIAPSSYMPSYSPPLSEQNQPLFPGTYQQPYLADYQSGYPTTAAPSLPAHYGPSIPQDPNSLLYPMPPVLGHAHGGPADGPGGVRVVQARPKPQCFDHGCNGRQFSTFSNLLRHQREKSGQAAKVACPNCGAEFTRTTARNGHLQHDKCKQRRSA